MGRGKKWIKGSCLVLTLGCVLLWCALLILQHRMPARFSVVEGASLELDSSVTVLSTECLGRSEREAAAMEAGSSYTASLRLLGIFPVKEVTVSVVEPIQVIPCGTPFGIKMFTDGVLVVGMSDVDTATGAYNPAKAAGMKPGDVIVTINGETVNKTEQVAQLVEESGGKTLTFHIRRDNIAFDVKFTPAKSVNENRWKAGMWVRDSSAGIGTLTFYSPSSHVFGGLGHAVCDVDTGEILPLSAGEIVPARIYSVVKGQSGEPGELRGGFESGELGNLTVNGETGIYGTLETTPEAVCGSVPVAMKQQVKTGKAQILTTINGTEPQYYDIEIKQVRYNDSSPTRNMVVEVTDSRLLEEAGGIVQGMSGSPILQNGRLVGAVTHVFVNDPTQGFGIFAENMLKTAQSAADGQQKPAA
ncbi:MAG: SpoIVB peptidase [Clostridiales bacterium]|nr:SpoIVB peptidase [Clostridiales bacterium]